MRLDRLRALEECRTLLARLTIKDCFRARRLPLRRRRAIDEDELRGGTRGRGGHSGITELRHVRASVEKRAAEEIANRTICEDFDSYKPLFERVQRELKAGISQTLPCPREWTKSGSLRYSRDQFFIVGGQIAYVARGRRGFQRQQYDRRDSRLRVIYDNGTESDLWLRSFQRSLYPDKESAGRIITNPDTGPFSRGA